MVPIGGKPFLEHLLLLLIQFDIRRFVFCCGYRAEALLQYFQDGGRWGCEITYSVEEKLLGSGGAIKKASSLLDPTFLVINGDNYLQFDYSDFICRFKQRQKPGVGMIVCWHNAPRLYRSNIALSEDRKMVTSYHYQDPKGKEYVDCGVKIFSRDLFSFFEARDDFSLEIKTLPILAARRLLHAYVVYVPPLDIGTPYALAKTRSELLATDSDAHEKS